MNVLVVGTIGFDTITTPFGEVADTLGGSAVYASLAARYFTEPHMIAVAGEDFSNDQHQKLRQRGINTDGIVLAKGKTFRWGGRYDYDLNQRETLFTELNVLKEFQPVLSRPQRASRSAFLGNIDPNIQLDILGQLPKECLVACDTMNYWIEKEHQALLAVLVQVSILIINDAELRLLTREYNLVKAARAIIKLLRNTEKQPATLIIKRGEYGVILFQKDQLFYVPGFPLEAVFDPTGAGDSFAGACLGYLAAVGSADWKALQQAVVYGSVLASFCVERFGVAGIEQLSRQAIVARYKLFKQLTDFENQEEMP